MAAADPLARYDDIFEAASKEWNVDPALLKAVARQESGGDPRAQSKAGAQGVMQIIPDTQRKLGVTDPSDPVQSIFGGAKYLNEALDKEGRPDLALLYYHGGPGWRDAYGPESRAYVPAVSAHYAAYKGSAPAPTARPAAPAARPAASAPAPAPAAPAPTVDDLHKAFGEPTGATPKPGEPGKASPSDEDLNAAFGPPAAATPKPAGETETKPAGPDLPMTADPYGTPWVGEGAPPNSPAMDRIVGAGVEGWRNTEPALTPRGEQAVGPVASFVSSTLVDTPRRAVNALVTGGMQGVMEATNALAPEAWGARLGRDIIQMAQVAPVYHAAPLEVPPVRPRPAGPPPPRPDAPPGPYPEIPPGGWRTTPEPPPASGTPGTPPEPTAGGPQPGMGGGGPSPGMGGPQPQSAGAAATPRGAAGFTNEEAARARTVADKEWFNTSQQPGVPDTRIHVPGIIPTLVEQEQSVVRARELKTLRNQNAEVSQSERELLDANSEKRKNFYNETAGSDVIRGADLKAAGEKIEQDLARVWKGKGEADPAGVQTQIAAELEGSAGHLPPLKSAMQQVSESLEKAGTDPETMYRTRRLINFLQSREGHKANPGYGDADVQAALTRTKKALDAAIEPAAPGFGQAMSDYASARGPLDAAKELQARELKLYDNKGRMSFPAVHSLVRDIIKAQDWDAPDHPLRFVSEDQFNRLRALHDDLKRVASAHDLEMARGSDSAQNFMDVVKGVGKTGAAMGAHAAANAVAPVAGSFVVNALGGALERGSARRQVKKQRRRAEEILRPEPPPNPLQPPD